MILYLIGIDHKKTPLVSREVFCFQRSMMLEFWRLRARQVSLFATCNRLELYGIAHDHSTLRDDIAAFGAAFPEYMSQAYVLYGRYRVARHALRLACGLESQIVGEREVAGQIAAWIEDEGFPQPLKYFWEKILRCSVHIRQKTQLNNFSRSLADFVWGDIHDRLRPHTASGKMIALIGTGRVAESLIRAFPGVYHLLIVASKKHSRARQIARRVSAEVVSIEECIRRISALDVLIGATSSPHFVVRYANVHDALKNREKPFYLYDLAVPRDIEPAIGAIGGVRLCDLDSFDDLFKTYNRSLSRQAAQTAALVEACAAALGDEDCEYLSSQCRHQAEHACV